MTFNFIFPLKIVAPPYDWSQANAGLIAVGTIIGYLLALPFLPASDRLAARLTKKNNGIREAEMRLGVLLPALIVAPAGLILFGMVAERDLHWIGYFFGVGMVQWAAYFYFTVTLAYAVDSYTANLSEFLIIANLGKLLCLIKVSANRIRETSGLVWSRSGSAELDSAERLRKSYCRSFHWCVVCQQYRSHPLHAVWETDQSLHCKNMVGQNACIFRCQRRKPLIQLTSWP